MRHAFSSADVRAAEAAAYATRPAGSLMHAAAVGLATTCVRLLGGAYGRHVVVLAGAGNNGGDALWAGAVLARRGARVEALLLSDSVRQPSLALLRAAGGRVVDAAPEAADLVLDGIVGLGGRGGLREPAAALAQWAERSAALVVAVDLPSGVDPDTGKVPGAAVRADVTVTFGALKPGLLAAPGASLAGAVHVVDIGLRPHLGVPEVQALQDADVAALLPCPTDTSDKYRRGVLGVVAGSDTYPGAAVLAVSGAARTGLGMVRFVSTAGPAAAVRAAVPEAVVTEADTDVLDAGRVQAWAVGPGMGLGKRARAIVAAVLQTDLPVVLDADAIAEIDPEQLCRRSAPTLLTPHAGELARLTNADRAQIETSPLRAAQEAAQRFGATVLLKGSTTVIATPAGATRINPTGTPLLATAGAGDVLTGCVGALLSAGLDPLDAGSVAAYLHGRAARLARGGAPVTAGDVAAALPQAWRSVTG